MSLSRLSETLIGSEIVKLGGEIREKIRNGHKIYNFTVGDFDPSIFPIPKELEDEIISASKIILPTIPQRKATWIFDLPSMLF
jgi:aspartate aminotransferase